MHKCQTSPAHIRELAYLGQNACSKERNDRNDRDNAHVTNPSFKRFLATPKCNCEQCDKQDVVVRHCQRILVFTHSRNFEVVFPSIIDMQESPDGDNRYGGDWESDREPLQPGQWDIHAGESDEVLW